MLEEVNKDEESALGSLLDDVLGDPDDEDKQS